MVVLDTNGPIRSETIFDPGAGCASPPSVGHGIYQRIRRGKRKRIRMRRLKRLETRRLSRFEFQSLRDQHQRIYPTICTTALPWVMGIHERWLRAGLICQKMNT